MDEHLPSAPTKGLPMKRGLLVAATACVAALMGVPKHELSAEEAAAVRTEHEVRRRAAELRGAIEEYRRDHDEWPGFPPGAWHGSRAEASWVVRQLTQASDERGDVSCVDDVPTFGPYLRSLPANPMNGRTDVRVVEEPASEMPLAADGRSGWIYHPWTGEIRLNAPGNILYTDKRYYDL